MPVVEAVEQLGCAPLLTHDAKSRARGDRYSSAMVWLVRSLSGGA